jgi:hypothetical protein
LLRSLAIVVKRTLRNSQRELSRLAALSLTVVPLIVTALACVTVGVKVFAAALAHLVVPLVIAARSLAGSPFATAALAVSTRPI